MMLTWIHQALTNRRFYCVIQPCRKQSLLITGTTNLLQHWNTENDGSGGNESHLHSECVRPKSWPAYRIFRRRNLVVFLRPSRQIPRRLSLEDEGTTNFRNVRNHLPNDTAPPPSRLTKWHVFDINHRISCINFDRNSFCYHKYVAN